MMRRTLAAISLSLCAAITAGCGSDDTGRTATTDSTPADAYASQWCKSRGGDFDECVEHASSRAEKPAASSSPTPVVSAPAAPTDVTTYTFNWTDPGGVTVNGVMKLASPMQGDDPGVAEAWSGLVKTAPSIPDCVDNPSRDAVVVGSVSFTNRTPRYAPSDVRIPIFVNGLKPPMLAFEIHYGSRGSGCGVVSIPGAASFTPDMTESAAWGPVAIAFVVRDVYGPSGFDEQAFKNAQFQLALGSDRSLKSTSPTLEQYGSFLRFQLPDH